MDICTIIAKNYVAQARVLARSFAEHHPRGHCSVLVIDDYEGYLDPDEEPFTILTPAEVGCAEFAGMAVRYDVLELSTAVKPWLLAHLLASGAPAITYLDPDICVHSSLESLDALAKAHGVVITPHNTVPLPDDGERPNQIDILLAGVYNLGYVSLGAREETSTLLRWWRQRLLSDCRVDPLNGYFVDQRWFDLAPGLAADRAIVRDPEYNVAYWNLHSRQLEMDGAGYTVDGRPLGFFHFSGFDPEKPNVLSRHQSRIAVEPGTALARICAEYAAEVIAEGYTTTRIWPYTYGHLPSGAQFTKRLRGLHEVASDRGQVTGSPFTQEGDAAFMSWLAEPAPAAPAGVNRLLADLYGTRSDLQDAFPDVGGSDHRAFMRWAARTGAAEEPTLALLPALEINNENPSAGEPAAESLDVGVQLAKPLGVNVVGYFRSELGTGEAARQVVSALDAVGVPLLPVHGRTIPPNRQGHAFTHLDYTDARYPVNLICMNADVLGEFASQAGPEFFEGRYSVGMWFWEVEEFPWAWRSAFGHVDELWLPTEHIVRALDPVSTVPITKITLPVEMPTVMPATRAELDLPDGFMFLFSFDHHSVIERKNPIAVLEAYKQAFEPEDGAVLVLKSINAGSDPEGHARLLEAGQGRRDVHIVDGYLDAARKDLLLASCDCYVSLHRAEGFGLTMAEAMYQGKPVVATAYSGNLDFMTPENSFLVDYELVPIGAGANPYPATARWAEPDVRHAARLLRDVFAQREQAAAVARRGAEDIRRTHSAAAAGAVLARRLEYLGEHHPELPEPAGGAQQSVALSRRLQDGPSAGARTPSRGPKGLARRWLLRLMKPVTEYQRSIDADIAGSLASLELKLHDLDASASERHATELAKWRADEEPREIWRRLAGLTRSTVALESVVGEMQRALQVSEREQRAIPHMEGSPFQNMPHPRAGTVQGFVNAEPAGPDSYRFFEDTFRGSEEFIRDRQRVFLELLDGHAPVLDLGCGRGEFLDLLAERGMEYMGVDSDAGMVRRCHEKGHLRVAQSDGLDFLDKLEDGSLGAIFCAQVIEHLPYEVLLRLFDLARRKLREDGLLIAETVNPHSAPALKTFWVDPTHQHPIFPEVALSLARASGFTAAFVFHPNGAGDVERDRFTQGEYALVAGGASLISSEEAEHDAASRVPERSVSPSAAR